MNTVILKGNLGGDPSIKTSGGTIYASFSIAVNQRSSRNGEPVTDWFRIIAFSKLAETLANIDKGDEVLVTGSLRRTSYTTRDGVVHHDVEVRAREIEFLRRSKRNAAEPLLDEEVEADEQLPDLPLEPDAGAETPAEFHEAEAPPELDFAAASSDAWPPAGLAQTDCDAQPPSEKRPPRRRAVG